MSTFISGPPVQVCRKQKKTKYRCCLSYKQTQEQVLGAPERSAKGKQDHGLMLPVLEKLDANFEGKRLVVPPLSVVVSSVACFGSVM